MATDNNLDALGKTLNDTIADLEKWKTEMSNNVDQFFLLLMGFIIYCKLWNFKLCRESWKRFFGTYADREGQDPAA